MFKILTYYFSGSLMRENDRLANEALNLSQNLVNQTYPGAQHQPYDSALNRSAAPGNTSYNSPANRSTNSTMSSQNSSQQASLNQSSFDVDDLKEQIGMLNNQLTNERHRGRVELLKAQKQAAFFESKCSQESLRYASRDAELDDLRAQLSRAGKEFKLAFLFELNFEHYKQIN